MARIRSIKPEFWTSAQVLECSTNARLLFVGLWNFCDDAGRHPASPKQTKAEVFPSDDFSIDEIARMIDELSTNGLITRYIFDNIGYFYVNGWHHQKIDRPQKPKYPDPLIEHSPNNHRAFAPDRIGEDRIGEEKKEDNTSLRSEKVSQETYFFESGVIRLKQKDFEKWTKAFSCLDLGAELISLATWAQTQENWFSAVSGALAKRNRAAKERIAQFAEQEKRPLSEQEKRAKYARETGIV